VQIDTLEKQTEKLKSEKAYSEQFYERQINELKTLMRDVKKTELQRSMREEELKSKIKSLEKNLEMDHPDLAMERKRLKQEFDR
jgi:hypothetical protein